MPGMFDEWDERRKRAQRPATPTTTATPVDPGRASAYALAALNGEVANLLAVPVGSGRNDQLNKSALKMYGYAEAGAISHDVVTETLGAADGGLDFPATRKTLESARAAAARQGARPIPETATQTREVPPWEVSATTSDDPFSDDYAAPPATSAAPTATSGDGSRSPLGSTSSSVAPTASDAANGDGSQPDPWRVLVDAEARTQRLRRDARRLLDHEDAVNAFRVPPFTATLADELALPDDPVTYTVAEVIPTGANVLLTAQYKTGKTTLVNHLTGCLADGRPFLDRYDVTDLDGRVAVFNYEVDAAQYRRWLRDASIDHADRVAVLNLRGYRLPLLVPHVEDWVVEWLKAANARVWIVDPFARAAVGSITSENDNTEVGAFLDTLDVIKDRAGVGELILPTHTGRGEMEQGDERARGATRLDDWADVRWLMTKDKQNTRYFRATGRDVDTDEAALSFDPVTRALSLDGGNRQTVERERYRAVLLAAIQERPGQGVRDLRDAVRAAGMTGGQDRLDSAIASLKHDRLIHTRKAGHKLGHFPGVDPDAFTRPDVPPGDPFGDP